MIISYNSSAPNYRNNEFHMLLYSLFDRCQINSRIQFDFFMGSIYTYWKDSLGLKDISIHAKIYRYADEKLSFRMKIF